MLTVSSVASTKLNVTMKRQSAVVAKDEKWKDGAFITQRL